jgi:hypothetical protein
VPTGTRLTDRSAQASKKESWLDDAFDPTIVNPVSAAVGQQFNGGLRVPPGVLSVGGPALTRVRRPAVVVRDRHALAAAADDL